jgi:hypothetical protein
LYLTRSKEPNKAQVVIPAALNSRKAGQAGLSTAQLVIHFDLDLQDRKTE